MLLLSIVDTLRKLKRAVAREGELTGNYVKIGTHLAVILCMFAEVAE